MIITIDGPVASGKSTIAKMLAIKLNYYYLNTGFLYRAIAYLLVKYFNFTLADLSEPKLETLTKCLDEILNLLKYEFKNGEVFIWYNGKNIAPFLKSLEIDDAASRISQISLVRNLLLPIQKNIGLSHNLVAEGRDCGTKIFPEAEFKFFLDADILIRADRWYQDQIKKNNNISLEEAFNYVKMRDERDTKRKLAPLFKSPDAVVIDSSVKGVKEVVDEISNLLSIT